MKDLDPWTLPLAGTALIEASAGTGKTYLAMAMAIAALGPARMAALLRCSASLARTGMGAVCTVI